MAKILRSIKTALLYCGLSKEDLETIITQLDELSKNFGIDIYAAISTTDGDIPESLKDKVMEAL